MTTGKNHGALNLLAEGLLRILQVKQNTDIADVDKALDLLNTSNPELIGWLHKRLLSCIARNISQGPASINHCNGVEPVHVITIQPRTGSRLLLPGIPGHQHMMDVDGRLTCGCIVEVAGGSTPVRPDAGSADVVEDTARRIAVLAHHGQRGKYGDMGMPYIVHIDRVVARMKTAELRAVAWLHDVLEDTDVTAPMLFASGIPSHIITAVQLLTRGSEPYQSESYETYITNLIASGNVLALRVKLADLDDHIEGRGSMRPTAAKLKRYEQARYRVSAALKGVQ